MTFLKVSQQIVEKTKTPSSDDEMRTIMAGNGHFSMLLQHTSTNNRRRFAVLQELKEEKLKLGKNSALGKVVWSAA